MIAVILNSGIGKRLGSFTEKHPKALLSLKTGEAVFGRQIRLLYDAGIRSFVVTTGPYEDQLRALADAYALPGATFTFVHNDKYKETNYIYSLWLAKKYIADDLILLHGDLVFDRAYICDVIASEHECLGSVNASLSQATKDFKARVVDSHISEVSVDLNDSDCVAFQPLYKLSKSAFDVWMSAIDEFISRGEVNVYAENAGNEIFDSIGVYPYSYEGHYLEEIDTPEDHSRVSRGIVKFDYRQQCVFRGEDALGCFAESVQASCFARPLLICGSAYNHALELQGSGFLKNAVLFQGFTSNPTFEEADAAFACFKKAACDSLVAIGGGSAIDVAKAVRWKYCEEHCELPEAGAVANGSKLQPGYRSVPFLAVSTTAGTGSEATCFAVVYDKGEKKSLDGPMLFPDYVALIPSFIGSVPAYHRAASYFDALSQAIESIWSFSSCEESVAYAKEALSLLRQIPVNYFSGDTALSEDCLRRVQEAAYLSGKAINLTRTTAAHAMSYKLTSLYGLAHGHAVAMCLPGIWQLAASQCESSRTADSAKLGEKLRTVCEQLGFGSSLEAIEWYEETMAKAGLSRRVEAPIDDVDLLANSVNQARLANGPITLSREQLICLYRDVIC